MSISASPATAETTRLVDFLFVRQVSADKQTLNEMKQVFSEPWIASDSSTDVMTELQIEINRHHPLFGKAVELVGRSLQADDYLFKVANCSDEYCVVHLTWTGRKVTQLLSFQRQFEHY
ncbi:hypothetical protein WBJ53_19665 [Spirosoma sp. SC4-14]|uniref:hypothetical protein n=1 Tax=Spirosoma sp. SC4-14 TaxID=3128900 RepID=UPI0030CD332A